MNKNQVYKKTQYIPWQELLSQIKPEELTFEPHLLQKYSTDKWLASHLPDAVAFPTSTESVVRIMRFASKYHIPVTPRGGGEGYVGGCVPVYGGIVLSLEKMNNIIEIDRHDFIAIVEAGVITAELQNAAKQLGLFYPPDPASRQESTIGGNIATNAGGPRCLKYGVTRDYVLGLEVVLSSGEVLQLGGRTHKNKTGFDLVRIFVGSEGLLGIVTKAILKLLPYPPYRAVILAGYNDNRAAARAIQRVFEKGLLPTAIEIADSFTLTAAYRHTKSKELEGCEALVIAEIDGQHRSVKNELKLLQDAMNVEGILFQRTAHGDEECERLWQIRSVFSSSLKDTGLKKYNEDIVIPRGRLVDWFEFIAFLNAKYNIPIACFGHAGDGNIHTNVMINESDPNHLRLVNIVLDEIFEKVLEWGGAITGEHGIGLARLPWWSKAVPENVRTIHQQIKSLFDPQGILNPGKFVQ